MPLIPLDVDYQRKERAKTLARLDELKKPKVIAREKPNANFSFKPTTFNLPPFTQLVLSCLESNYFSSSTPKDSHLGFERFIRRNLFDLRTNPSTFSFFLSSFAVIIVEVKAIVETVFNVTDDNTTIVIRCLLLSNK